MTAFSRTISFLPESMSKRFIAWSWIFPLQKEMQEGFAAGVALNDGVCKAAKLVILGEKTAEVTLQEGRYHQIKRMFGCFGAKVVSLHRLAMGNLYLPADLPEGACRELTAEELNQLQMHES